MTRTAQLLALAEAATQRQTLVSGVSQEMMAFSWAANPETIRQLVELVRLQHEALEAEAKYARRRGDDVVAWVDQSIEAFKAWEAGK